MSMNVVSVIQLMSSRLSPAAAQKVHQPKLQDFRGLQSLQNGFILRSGLSQIIRVCKEYVGAVCNTEDCPNVSQSFGKALDGIGKQANRNAKNKSQPPMQDWIMSWSKLKDDTGELETILRDDRWALSDDQLSSFLAQLRPVLQRLADPSRHEQSLNYRKDIHLAMQFLASDSQSPEVCSCF